MKRALVPVVSLLCLLVAFSGNTLFAQLADRAVITGIVTDPSGAAVPDAKVSITNQDTGAVTLVGSNSAGNFSTPPLILGRYSVTVEKPGFKTYTHGGLLLSGGQTLRQDVKLDVGAVTETVQVEGGVEQINTENATVSHTISQTYYRDMPAVMGADIRLAESLLQLQPGYVPMQPNGDAIFRGSQFTSRINGGQTMATENWFDGAAFGYAEGHQQTQESSIPYPSVQEMTVVENTFSAQYGHTSGGFITYTTKSGTDKFHGNLYDFYTSNHFDASNYFVGPKLKALGLKPTLPLGQNNWGFALGGPVPKAGKTFWFFNLDGLDYHSTVNTGYVNTLPTPLQRAGDFSEFLDTTKVVAHDALNRPIFQGEIFNPTIVQMVGTVPVRNGYGFDSAGNPIPGQANVIPLSGPNADPLWVNNPLAQFVVPNIPNPDRAGVKSNGFGGSSDDNNKINVRTWLLRLDHTFNSKFSISNTYYQNTRPRTAHCGGPQGCTTTHNGQTDSAANDTYIGQGFYQHITNHFEHLQMNWVIKNNLFNHTTLAFDRWNMNGHQLSAGVGWNQKLGLGLPNQPIFNNAGFPELDFNGNIGYTHYGTAWDNGGSDINNRYQFLDDVSWITGKHTIKAGFEYRYMLFPQTGWAVNTGGIFRFNNGETAGFDSTGKLLSSNTGNEFASFLLGQVDNAFFNAPFEYTPVMKYASPWVNDDIKVTPKLSLTFGLRFDWQSGLHERNGHFSTFDPSAPNPVGVPGATVFSNSKATGESNWNVGPRFGFAYAPSDKNVIRGGYGIYYAAVQADSWDPYPVDGYQTNPTAPNTFGSKYPAFYFNGTSACPGQVASLNPTTPTSCGWPAGTIVLPPQLRPDVMNNASPVGVYPKTYLMPRYQNWSLSYQRQLSNNMAIDIAYVGNHGTRLIDGRSSAGVYDNMNPGSVLSCGGAALGAQVTNGVLPNASTLLAGCPDIAGKFASGVFPYATFNGTVAQAIRSWPQYQQILWRSFPFGNSHYNALQVSFNRRMSAGLTVKVAYTRSRLMNNGSETGLASGGPPVQNPSDMRDMISVSSDDVPNILSLGWVYQFPFGKGKAVGRNAPAVLDKLIGGWQISGMQSYSSGRPLSITTNNNLGPYLFNYAKFPDKVGSGLVGHFNNNPNNVYLNENGWAAPGGDPNALAFGNAPRMDQNVRGFPYYNEDVSIFKDTHFGEGKYVRFEADGGNVLNRVFFCPVDQFWLPMIQTPTGPQPGNSNFGKTGSQCNIPRRIQFGLQLFF